MKINSIHIQNFRSFLDEKINLNRYACFVGPNGAGKSTVLAALNVFFQDKNGSQTDVSKLVEEDYFRKDTSNPIRITLVFDELGESAKTGLSEYVRHEELVVTAEAEFNSEAGYGEVRHFGQRQGIEAFRPFFDAMKAGAKAPELTQVYDSLRKTFTDLPNPKSKDDKAEALRAYESEHSDKCSLIPSQDVFYGFNSTGKLAEFVQWVFVPAVKDASEESQEAKNTALGKLIARAVRSRSNFDEELVELKSETLKKYRELLDLNQTSLTEISTALQLRLGSWAHGNVRLDMQWISDPVKSVVLQTPVVGIRTGDGDFLGSITRMGHGLQRSYLLALLQELADSESENAPTLILGVEEPELYQHPPQARHMADVLYDLSKANNQVLVTTHSPLFVSGDGFEDTRVVRPPAKDTGSEVKAITFNYLCHRIRSVTEEASHHRNEGLIAKIHQALQPGIAEMFFAKVPVLVEGLEDVSYITSELYLEEKWNEFRRLGCHLIPVNGKHNIIQPLAIAAELNIPVFTVFDADGDTERLDRRAKHERDNRAIISLLGAEHDLFPLSDVIGNNHAIWSTNLGDCVKKDFGENYDRLAESARQHYAHEGGLEKNDHFIVEWLTAARKENLSSATLQQLCEAILAFAREL